MTDDRIPKTPAELLEAMKARAAEASGGSEPSGSEPSEPEPSGSEPGVQDLLTRLAWRLCTPPEVTPSLGLRFAPTPDLPDDETARWRREWRADSVK